MDLDSVGDTGDNEPPARVCCLQGWYPPGQEGHRRLTPGRCLRHCPVQSEVLPKRAAALAHSAKSPLGPWLQHQAPLNREPGTGLAGHTVPESGGRAFGLEGGHGACCPPGRPRDCQDFEAVCRSRPRGLPAATLPGSSRVVCTCVHTCARACARAGSGPHQEPRETCGLQSLWEPAPWGGHWTCLVSKAPPQEPRGGRGQRQWLRGRLHGWGLWTCPPPSPEHTPVAGGAAPR